MFLPMLFRSLESALLPPVKFSIVLVDSASTDQTRAILAKYAAATSLPVTIVRADKPGLSVARNTGVAAAAGEMIFFTDDDCRLHPQFFKVATKICSIKNIDFGGGQVLLGAAEDDSRVANLYFDTNTRIAPNSGLLPAGFIHGANLFARQAVIKDLLGFNEEMGVGTDFPCEDIDFCNRASQAGFSGARIGELAVYHHHGKRKGSVEADSVREGYDRGRGAYHIANIETQADDVWRSYSKRYSGQQIRRKPALLQTLQRELSGAADYLSKVDGAVANRAEAFNFQSLLIVTHGRSGSTLLQGIVNSIPGVVCKGENNNVAYHWFQGLRAIEHAQEERKRLLADDPTHPWYGIHAMSRAVYLQSCKQFIRDLVLTTAHERATTRCYGFKEIRYADCIDELPEYLAFLRDMMPNPLIIFLTRDTAEVKKSKWWRDMNEQKVEHTLAALADVFRSEVAQDPQRHLWLDYADLISCSDAVRELFERLDAQFCAKTYADVLGKKHSY